MVLSQSKVASRVSQWRQRWKLCKSKAVSCNGDLDTKTVKLVPRSKQLPSAVMTRRLNMPCLSFFLSFFFLFFLCGYEHGIDYFWRAKEKSFPQSEMLETSSLQCVATNELFPEAHFANITTYANLPLFMGSWNIQQYFDSN